MLRHRRGLRVRRAGRLQQARRRQQVGQQVERDVVEHDRDDHLVRARRRLQHARDPGPQRPGDDARDHRHDQVQPGRQVEREADPARGRPPP